MRRGGYIKVTAIGVVKASSDLYESLRNKVIAEYAATNASVDPKKIYDTFKKWNVIHVIATAENPLEFQHIIQNIPLDVLEDLEKQPDYQGRLPKDIASKYGKPEISGGKEDRFKELLEKRRKDKDAKLGTESTPKPKPGEDAKLETALAPKPNSVLAPLVVPIPRQNPADQARFELVEDDGNPSPVPANQAEQKKYSGLALQKKYRPLRDELVKDYKDGVKYWEKNYGEEKLNFLAVIATSPNPSQYLQECLRAKGKDHPRFNLYIVEAYAMERRIHGSNPDDAFQKLLDKIFHKEQQHDVFSSPTSAPQGLVQQPVVVIPASAPEAPSAAAQNPEAQAQHQNRL